MTPPALIFIRCGGRYAPPADGCDWHVVTLPAELRAEHLPAAVAEVRALLQGYSTARLLIAGPVTLGVAMGQGLAHEPTAIDYVQLNQATKAFEIWVSNRHNI